MSKKVECKICNRVYANRIRAGHLRDEHGIDREEYEKRYGRGSSYANYQPPENVVECKICNKYYKNKIGNAHLQKFHGTTRGEYELKYGKGSSYFNYQEPEIPEEQKIECQICNQIFKNTITSAHLKLHNITTKEYKKMYGDKSLKTEYIRREYSKKYKGKNNPNYNNRWSDAQREHMSNVMQEGYNSGKYVSHQKGKPLSEEQKNKMSLTKKALYAEGKLFSHNKGKSVPPEVRGKISKSVKEYAANNPEEMSRRACVAYQTRVKNGNWKPIINPYTPETRVKISKQSKKHAKIKSEKSYNTLYNFITDEGYTIIDMDADSKGYITFICNCGSDIEHTVTRQLFHDSKYKPYEGWCRFCDYGARSRGEKEITEFINSLDVETISNYRGAIYPHELDIYIPEHKIAIEFNGLYWHSELVGKDKHYHNKKRDLCDKNGIRLIQVFEDEWNVKPDIVKSIITNALNIVEIRLFARKCIIKEIDVSTARSFIDTYHISGYHACSIKYGLYYDDELVSVMTFSKNNHSRKGKGWEIDRYCSKSGLQVVGGASKLFKHFIRKVQPSSVVSYADLRYGNGGVYEKIGFKFEKDTAPNYWYFKDHLQRHHRFTLRKGAVDGDDTNKTEWENRIEQGWNRIWDCGSRKYVWNAH